MPYVLKTYKNRIGDNNVYICENIEMSSFDVELSQLLNIYFQISFCVFKKFVSKTKQITVLIQLMI